MLIAITLSLETEKGACCMRIFFIILSAAFIFISSPASAGDKWTAEDTAYQAAVSALIVADWMQTRWIAKSGSDRYFEANPLIGRHPSASRVDAYFAASMAFSAAVSFYLLDQPNRRTWQGIWIGYESGFVIHNYSLGVQFGF